MSKIRIYELAKELGIDNKAVIDKAKELGFDGKASHSNSLEGDEADQIRRAIIRNALGSAPAEIVESATDAEGKAITVRRKGNIIRRRRETLGESDGVEPENTRIDLAQPLSLPVKNEAVIDPDSIFKRKEDAVQEAVPEAVLDEESKPVEIVEAQEIEEDVQETETASDESTALAVPEVRTTPGPKVLGKIELPSKRVKPSAKAKEAVVVAEIAEVVVPKGEDEESRDQKRRGGSKDKRSKKREFRSADLVDYDAMTLRRGPRRRMNRKDGDDRGAIGDSSKTEVTQPKASKRVIRIDEVITVGELAKTMSLKVGDIITKLIDLGIMATINQTVDLETASVVAAEFDFTVESATFDETTLLADDVQDDPTLLLPRPPVVTVMGHVDHGKTSLLDAVRDTAVAAKEHGGITQHIGAYMVSLPKGPVTFVDTPGHEAFTAMRARGAEVTDIVVLVVAADDGVMPQTVEAINHAKAANVPIVVAINKMDKGGANPDRVKQALSEHGLQPEDWGGDTMFFPISALKRQGLEALLEGVLLQAEVKELRANPNRRAVGAIIESRQERGRGTVATVLVQNGTLKVGDAFVSGSEYGRVRSMIDHLGKEIMTAGPSVPVEITGLAGMPGAGDDFHVLESDSKARQVAEVRSEKKKRKDQLAGGGGGPITLEEFAKRAAEGIAPELNVIVKADVQGSMEAVCQSLTKASTEKVKVRIVHASVGGVTESDVKLALTSKAIVLGFGVRAELRVSRDAEANAVQLRFYNVIYDLVDDIKKAMAGLLAPIRKEANLGRVEVRDTFTIPKIGTVAGGYVVDGLVRRGAFIRLLRDSRVVHEGKIASLRHLKDDVRELKTGYECGVSIDQYNDIKIGDVIEVFEIQEHAATLD